MRYSRKFLIGFLCFFCAFFGIVACIAVSAAIGAKNYGGLTVFLLITAILTVSTVIVSRYFFSLAERFEVTETEVLFFFGERVRSLPIAEIREIITENQRYVFRTEGEKLSVIRPRRYWKGISAGMEDRDRRLDELAKRYQIRLTVKW